MGKPACLGLVVLAGCYTGSATPPPEAPARPAPVDRHARTAADPLGFLPVDAEVVIGLDTGSLRRSPVWPTIEPVLLTPASGALEKLRLACGFDLVPQIDRIAIGVRHVGTPDVEAVVVIGGPSRSQLMGCMTRAIRSNPGLARIERNVVMLAPQTAARPFAFAFAGARTLVLLVGQRADAQGVRDVLDAGAPLRASDSFPAMIGRVDLGRDAWFLLDGSSKLFDNAGGSLGMQPRAVFGGIDLPAGAAAKLFVRMASPADATKVVTLMQGQRATMKTFFDKMEVTAEDVDVIFDLALTEAQVRLVSTVIGP